MDRERRQQLRQTRDQLEELQDIVGGSEDVSDHKVLSQLEEKLNAYIQELPVLGFNVLWQVRPECLQRIPVPVPHQASARQVYCEKE